MLSKPTTLVLGAGSSLAFGYPTGGDLRNQLLALTTAQRVEFSIQAGLFEPDGEIHRFLDSFSRSQMESIDAFLARRPEFTDIGKRAIAALLLAVEGQLHTVNEGDLWHRYLFNRLAEEQWDALDFSDLKIVTFNYDRSLEHYLLMALQHSYGKSEVEAVQKLRSLKIIHVYGALGGVLPGDKDYLPYGAALDNFRAATTVAARHLQVIPEGRDDEPRLELARRALLRAEQIVFLGFGYDEINMRRLDSENTCRTIFNDGVHERQARIVYGTSIGLTEAEVSKAKGSMGESRNLVDLRHVSCRQLLRETLALD